MKAFGNAMYAYAVRYADGRKGPTPPPATPGTYGAIRLPSVVPSRINALRTKAARKRPPRYSARLTGAVYARGSIRVSTSRAAGSPATDGATSSHNRQPMRVAPATADGELIQ